MSTARTLADVIGQVELVDVRLMDAAIKTGVRTAEELPNAHLVANHGIHLIATNDTGFLVRAVLDAKVVSGDQPEEGDKSDAPIRIVVAFALEYALAGAEQVSGEVLAEFCRVNAAFNAWPYFREFVLNASARMQLPPVILPVLRIATPRKPPKQEEHPPTDAKPAANVRRRKRTRVS